jgi:hypothetical protein
MSEVVFRDRVEIERIDADILRLRAKGYTGVEIADQLGLGASTVHSRVRSMFRRGELPPVPRKDPVKADRITVGPLGEA